MHIIVFVAVIALLIYLIVSRIMQPPLSNNHASSADAPALPAGTGSRRHGLAFISNGKLFYQAPEEDELRELQSPHVRTVTERMERHHQLHGWKEGTAFGTSMKQNAASPGAVQIQAVSAQFAAHNRVLYILRDESFGGLFEYNLTQDKEKRLLHKQFLSLDDLRLHPKGQKLLCTQYATNGAANVIGMDADGNNFRELTGGDTIDAAPAWVPEQPNSVLFQSSGLARSEAGYVVAHGPTSIQMADTVTGELTTVLEDPRMDFLQPRVGDNGYLYFIRRPYEKPKHGFLNSIADILLFPFRLLRAIFHYLNFFSLMYTRKPLTTASGPAVEADIKDILIKGKRLDAEAALRKHNKLGGVPSLVPSSWQLVCRSPEGQEHVLASNVASFDLADDGTVIFTNGYGVFQLDGSSRPKVLLKNKLILEVVAAPDRSGQNIKIW